MDWANFGPKKLISPSGPGPAQKAGLGQDPPGPAKKTGGGNYFPPTPACKTLFVLHAEKEKKVKMQEWGRRRVTWRGGGGASLVCRLRWRCCGGGRWRCQAALWFQRQLQAVLQSPTVQRRSSRFLAVLSFSHVPSRFLAFLPLSVGFLVSLSSVSVDFLSYSLSLVFFSSGYLPLFSLFFRFSPLFPFLLPGRSFSQRSWVLFIEPRAWLFLMGSSWLVGHWARLPRFGSTRFSGRCVVGQCVRSVGSRRERDRKKFKQKPLFPFFPAAMFGGEEERGTVSFKTTPFCSSFFLFFFFFFECMKRHRFGENAPFHLNVAPECAKFQISP